MEADDGHNRTSNRRIALLIDADNVSHLAIAANLAELSRYGTANIRRAYGDWGSGGLKGWKDKLHDFAIRPIQQFSYSTGKNATDIALTIDAMELLYTQRPDAYCIASSDADFTPLVMQLKCAGHEVYGFGKRKTPTPFVNACSRFLYLDTLVGSDPVEHETKASTPLQGASPRGSRSALDKPPVPALADDAGLITILRGAVEATAQDNGWAFLATAGSAAKRQASIDPRNYGMRNFPALFAATGLFDIFKAEGGQGYVADKRNEQRAQKPFP